MKSLEARAVRLLKIVASTLITALVIAIVLYYQFESSPQQTPTVTTTGPSVAAGPTVAPDGRGVIGVFAEPDDGRAPVIDELDAARSSIDLMIYLLTDPAVIQGLEDAEGRGVRVRVILEQNPYGGYGNPETVKNQLTKAGAEVRWSSSKFTFTHAKTLIVDRSQALLLTMNLTKSSFDSNREFGVVSTRPSDVNAAEAIFDADWNGQQILDVGPLVVSPVNSRSQIEQLIASATSTIDIYAEVVRDEEIVSLLKQKARAGIAIRLILTPDNDPSSASLLDALQRAGVTIHLLSSPYIHAKVVLVDGNRVFVGSENFTATSLDDNREIGLITNDRTIVKRITTIFAHDYAVAPARD